MSLNDPSKTWEDHISYEEILHKLQSHKVHTIEIMIQRSRLEKLNEIIHMQNHRILKMITIGEPKAGARKSGRQQKSWRESVKEDLKIFDINPEQVINY